MSDRVRITYTYLHTTMLTLLISILYREMECQNVEVQYRNMAAEAG